MLELLEVSLTVTDDPSPYLDDPTPSLDDPTLTLMIHPHLDDPTPCKHPQMTPPPEHMTTLST